MSALYGSKPVHADCEKFPLSLHRSSLSYPMPDFTPAVGVKGAVPEPRPTHRIGWVGEASHVAQYYTLADWLAEPTRCSTNSRRLYSSISSHESHDRIFVTSMKPTMPHSPRDLLPSQMQNLKHQPSACPPQEVPQSSNSTLIDPAHINPHKPVTPSHTQNKAKGLEVATGTTTPLLPLRAVTPARGSAALLQPHPSARSKSASPPPPPAPPCFLLSGVSSMPRQVSGRSSPAVTAPQPPCHDSGGPPQERRRHPCRRVGRATSGTIAAPAWTSGSCAPTWMARVSGGGPYRARGGPAVSPGARRPGRS